MDDSRVDVDELRERWVGFEFAQATFDVRSEDLVEWAVSSGETDPRFTDPSHPDFQAQAAYPTHFNARRVLPEDFPTFGSGRGIDGGKSVDSFAPIRPGDTLTAHVELADIYEKTGRSGTMVFIVNRMKFVNQHGVHVATVDWKMIRN
jgi:hypothetical protein